MSPVARDIEQWWDDQQRGKRRRETACRNKRWFASEQEARAAALWDRTQFGERLRPHHCEVCDGWHLTSARG
jgi:hypothetical protein